jgi:hypothetical protein
VSAIPIRLRPAEVHIHADRRLAFQVITAFEAAAGGLEARPKILSREGGRLLVEFHTPVRGLFGGRKVYRTVEWVTLDSPKGVEFEGVEGPLSRLRDRLVLSEEDGCTRLRYESEIGVGGWAVGWLVGVLVVRPLMARFMREHLRELKETIEARAQRSHLYPQPACSFKDAEERHGR